LSKQLVEATGSDFLDPVKAALGSLGSILGVMAAALILFLAVALPIGGIVYMIKRLTRPAQPEQPLASEG
jgi:hypothetical protein